jgi:hypothetical protein
MKSGRENHLVPAQALGNDIDVEVLASIGRLKTRASGSSLSRGRLLLALSAAAMSFVGARKQERNKAPALRRGGCLLPTNAGRAPAFPNGG